MFSVPFGGGMIYAHELANGLLVTANNATKDGQRYFTHDKAVEFARQVEKTGWRLPTMSEMISLLHHPDQRSPFDSVKDGYIRPGEVGPCRCNECARFWLADSEGEGQARAIEDTGIARLIQVDKEYLLTVRFVKKR